MREDEPEDLRVPVEPRNSLAEGAGDGDLRPPTAILLRGLLGGVSAGGLLGALAVLPDSIEAQVAAQPDVTYPVTWSAMLVAVPVGAVVGFLPALLAVVVWEWQVPRGRRRARVAGSATAALTVVATAAVVQLLAAVALVVVAAVVSFGIAYLSVPLITTRRRPRRPATAGRPADDTVCRSRRSTRGPRRVDRRRSRCPEPSLNGVGRGCDAGRVRPPLLLSGPPAAGKSTTAMALARSSRTAAMIDVDDVRHLVVAGHAAPWEGAAGLAQQQLGVENACALARRFLRAGVEVVLADVVTPATAALYRSGLPELRVVRLQLPLAEARRRARLRAVHLTDRELDDLHASESAGTFDVEAVLDVAHLAFTEQVRAVSALWDPPV